MSLANIVITYMHYYCMELPENVFAEDLQLVVGTDQDTWKIMLYRDIRDMRDPSINLLSLVEPAYQVEQRTQRDIEQNNILNFHLFVVASSTLWTKLGLRRH